MANNGLYRVYLTDAGFYITNGDNVVFPSKTFKLSVLVSTGTQDTSRLISPGARVTLMPLDVMLTMTKNPEVVERAREFSEEEYRKVAKKAESLKSRIALREIYFR